MTFGFKTIDPFEYSIGGCSGVVSGCVTYSKLDNKPIFGYVNILFYRTGCNYSINFNDDTIGKELEDFELHSVSGDFGYHYRREHIYMERKSDLLILRELLFNVFHGIKISEVDHEFN